MTLIIEFENNPNLPLDKVYYLATPFSHQDKLVEYMRYREAVEIGYLLNLQGYTLIEPISMAFNKHMFYKLPGNAEYWKNINHNLIDVSYNVIVAKMDGWELSKGIKDEIAYAKATNKEVHYLTIRDPYNE
jgi:hypothetical protein